MAKKWECISDDIWNKSWIVAENNASNTIVDYYHKNIVKPTWIDLYDNLRGPIEDFLHDAFYAIGRASLPKKEMK